MTLEPNKDLRPGDTVTITCSSYRGYPEAEVFWQDGQGAPLTGNVTTSQMAKEQGLWPSTSPTPGTWAELTRPTAGARSRAEPWG